MCTLSLNVCSGVAYYSLSNDGDDANNYGDELAYMQVGRQKDSTACEIFVRYWQERWYREWFGIMLTISCTRSKDEFIWTPKQ